VESLLEAQARAGFRTPMLPAPIERHTVTLPGLPLELVGFKVLHLTDLHLRRRMHRKAHRRWDELLGAMERTPADIVCLTGDYVDERGQEAAAAAGLRELVDACRSKLGVFGIFGNHDTPVMRALAREVAGVRWIGGSWVDLDSVPMRVMGLDWPEDVVSVVMEQVAEVENQPTTSPPSGRGQVSRFTLALAHMPSAIVACEAFGVPLVLCGHTHGGQIRVSPQLAPHTSGDTPMHLAAGVIRLGATSCAISRGVGDGVVEGLRINCPVQVPMYELAREEGVVWPMDGVVRQVVAW
jgi:predicted MPP superfamily phosphohydrolase